MLRRAWAMEIVLVLAAGPMHFNEIKRRLDVPASTLSTRLDDLEGAGLVRRSAAGGPPAPVHYELTNRGSALAEPLGAIDALADGEQPTPR